MKKVKRLIALSLMVGLVSLSSCVDTSEEITPDVPDASDPVAIDGDAARIEPLAANDDLTSLPPDTGGEHVAKPKGSTSAAFGYYVYLPGGYSKNTKSYPLIVFLHGKGERGNGTTDLGKVLNQGIPNLIKRGAWKDKPRYPAIVVSPQYDREDGVGNENNWGEGDASKLKNFIEHAASTYRVNKLRIYVTGLSHGGNGVFDYLIKENDATSHVAAAAPIAAWAPHKYLSTCKNTPIWIFCGALDGSILKKYGNAWTGLSFKLKYNAQIPAPKYNAKFTLYPGVGHGSWARTYDLTGMGNTDPLYDPYSTALYDWMFQYKRSAY